MTLTIKTTATSSAMTNNPFKRMFAFGGGDACGDSLPDSHSSSQMAVSARHGIAGIPAECGLRLRRGQSTDPGPDRRFWYNTRKLRRHGNGYKRHHKSIHDSAFRSSVVHSHKSKAKENQISIALPLFSSCPLTKNLAGRLALGEEPLASSRQWSSKSLAMMDEDESIVLTGRSLFPKYLSNTTSTLITFLTGVAPRMLITK